MSPPIIFDYPPSANRYWRHVGSKILVSENAKNYRQKAAFVAMRAGVVLTENEVRLTLNVYRPRKSGDLDNALKVLIDALRGVAYRDDKQVVEIHAKRFDDKHNPRVELTIEEIKP